MLIALLFVNHQRFAIPLLRRRKIPLLFGDPPQLVIGDGGSRAGRLAAGPSQNNTSPTKVGGRAGPSPAMPGPSVRPTAARPTETGRRASIRNPAILAREAVAPSQKHPIFKNSRNQSRKFEKYILNKISHFGPQAPNSPSRRLLA